MGRKVQQTIDRILALGYTEATRRSSNLARLDALTEITAAVCDLFARAPKSGTFYLSHVDVLHKGRIISSTLAPFDLVDIAKALPDRFSARFMREWSLRLPRSGQPAGAALCDLWREAISRLGLVPPDSAAERSDATPLSDFPKEFHEVAKEFHASLRHAFGTIVEEEAADAFTLRVEQSTRRYPLQSGNHAAHSDLALGYCLSSRRLLEVFAKLEKHFRDKPSAELNTLQSDGVTTLTLLETALQPMNGAFRSQSHTNVTTRTAGLVLGQQARSDVLAKPQTFCLPSGAVLSASLVRQLELAAWGEVAPPNIYLMPLTNHDLVASNQRPRTMALWYVARNDPPSPEAIEALVARRYRGSLLFAEIMYQRYCNAVARELAKRIIRGETTTGLLNGALERIGTAYSISPPVKVSEPTTDRPSLAQRIRNARESHVPGVEKDRAWNETTDTLLHTLSVETNSPRRTAEMDLLLRFVRSLELESNRVGGRGHAAFDTITREITNLRDLLRSAANTHHRLAAGVEKALGVIEYPLAQWARVRALKELVNGTGGCPHSAKETHDAAGWTFAWFHDHCAGDCPLFQDECVRRLRYLLGWEATAAASGATTSPTALDSAVAPFAAAEWTRELAALYLADASSRQKFWELVKLAARDSTEESPTIATLVALLLMERARVSGWDDSAQQRLVRDAQSAWRLSLKGIAELSKPSPKHGGQAAQIELSVGQDWLKFKLHSGGLKYNEWFDGALAKLVGAKPRGFEGHSRSRDIAAAYMVDWDQQVPSPTDGRIGAVTIRRDEDALTCVWHELSFREP